MLRVLEASAGTLNMAGACGIPFIGAAGIVVQDIIKICDDLKLHKVPPNILTDASRLTIHSENPSIFRTSVDRFLMR